MGGDLEARSFDAIVDALRAAVPVLHEAEIPFLLGGSMAVWAYGGPEPVNDLDLMFRPQDAERAQQALARAGFRTGDPPEEWLLKAWHHDVLVDLIFAPRGVPIDDDTLARGNERSLSAIRLRVMALEDVLTSKLLALDEHQLDMSYLLQLVRAVREQVDWDELRRRTADSPYAEAFLLLAERLGISAPPGTEPTPAPPATTP
ncbi:nucleotidyltransferase [Conexibacter stalactiti]|uniref:Nucleotidyltransferase n=1 Tax=Conexibacter stalactiti TaxID=1940611 RepID=A0ABU4HTG2_9ACTN|nr:nucleotidyltransferase [Conexibacter stalactiti]MDW5596601.1 nucleotidyltransferase [Conexibacter stalactiti]MEC5037243.1 nucleotidyltransferase [Conexibacter stalactiti]